MFLIEIDSGQQICIYKVRDQEQAVSRIVERAGDPEHVIEVADALDEGGYYTDDDFTCWYLRDELKEDVDLTGEK